MFDRLTLSQDLVDCRGAIIGRRGLVISPEAIADAAQRATAAPRRALARTALAEELHAPLARPAYAPLFARERARDQVARLLAAVELPDVLVEELVLLRTDAPALVEHAVATAAVASRILLAAVGESRSLPELAAAALLHDVGMRHLPRRLFSAPERLGPEDAHRIAAHPLLGAYHLATVLGIHPAVAAARSHHWRCGQGYPRLAGAPSRSIEVISVASAFVALTQPRPYRSAAYDARGAADVLVAEALARHADANTVKLLVHALRGGEGDPRAVRFGVPREGHAPEVNRYGQVAAPERSPL